MFLQLFFSLIHYVSIGVIFAREETLTHRSYKSDTYAKKLLVQKWPVPIILSYLDLREAKKFQDYFMLIRFNAKSLATCSRCWNQVEFNIPYAEKTRVIKIKCPEL